MIALVFCGDIKYCPYINRYLERLDKLDYPYDVLFWNRSGFSLDLPDNYFYFNVPSDLSKRKSQKLFDFIGFRTWLVSRFSKKKYDKIIVLSTLSGIVIRDVLKKMSGRYIFDIRDYSYEHIPLFYHTENHIIKDSYFTAISSQGFRSFLPQHDYIVAHNFNRNEIISNTCFRRRNKPINLVWNGTIRYFDFQKQYIDALKNDDRFVLTYHGMGPESDLYQNYCEKNDIRNVYFTGGYDNSKKHELLQNASILNNCYGLVSKPNEVKYAVSNRFYDGIIFHIPQLVEIDSYKAFLTKNLGLGVSFLPDNKFANALYDYYMQIDEESFNQNCNEALSNIINEDDFYIQKIDDFILM